MPNIRLLSLASILVFALVAFALKTYSPSDLSGYGGIISAGGSLLAVTWFSAGLWYQSQQLNEQRTQLNEQRIQFLAEFKHLQNENHRESLQLAKTILETSEQRALSQLDGVSSVSDLLAHYMNFHELKPILESDDADVVLKAFKAWSKKETAAMILLRGIKSAAEVHLKSADVQGIDYSLSPEDFVFIHGVRFWKLPFFDAYEGPATMLSNFMVNLEPGRKAAQIAFMAATGKTFGTKILHMDKVREDIQKHTARGYDLPKIAEGL